MLDRLEQEETDEEKGPPKPKPEDWISPIGIEPGTLVTIESFNRWAKLFEEEQAKFKPAEKKLSQKTGKQIFLENDKLGLDDESDDGKTEDEKVFYFNEQLYADDDDEDLGDDDGDSSSSKPQKKKEIKDRPPSSGDGGGGGGGGGGGDEEGVEYVAPEPTPYDDTDFEEETSTADLTDSGTPKKGTTSATTTTKTSTKETEKNSKNPKTDSKDKDNKNKKKEKVESLDEQNGDSEKKK